MAAYRRALAIAKEQEAKLFELRAAVGLARLLARHEGSSEARAVLEPVCGWFSQDGDLEDVREARTVLASLSQ